MSARTATFCRAMQSTPHWLVQLSACVAALLVCGSVRANCSLVVLGESQSHTLTQDEEWCTVIIGFGGSVHTNGHKLTITGSGGLTILDSDSQLFIDSGTLLLTGGGSHYVAGGIKMTTASSLLQITSANSTFSGPGWIRGYIEGAKIDIAANTKFRITGSPHSDPFRICGRLTMLGSGEFRNDGKVAADEPAGLLVIGGSLVLSGGGVFEAKDIATATLSINVDSVCASMNARFLVSDGAIIEFLSDADIRTSNIFNPSIQCGTLNFDASGGSFTYNCGGSSVTISSDTTYDGGCT